jgi:hypothetical protein
MKVLKGFYCPQEQKDYAVGDEYTGKRTDLAHVLEAKKAIVKKAKKYKK